MRWARYAGTLLPSGLPNPNLTCPDPSLEARCVFKYLQSSVYPHLSEEQRVFVVPGLYGGHAAPDAATDRTLTAKFELYWELAVKDPRVVGIKALSLPQLHCAAATLLNHTRLFFKGACHQKGEGQCTNIAAHAFA